jgi:hypothetical protein
LKQRCLLLLVASLLIVAGCNRDPVFREMSDSTYIQTMVALRRLPIGRIDSLARARQRDSILNAFGVTPAELEAIALRLSEDPERAAVIFRAIENPSTSSRP